MISTQKFKSNPEMGPSKFLLFLIFTVFCILGSSSDYPDLVFKRCADQKFQDLSGILKQDLKNLFEILTSHSSTAKFFKTSCGNDPSAINGLFQCRGDLSNEDCKNCVQKTSEMAEKLCGEAVGARLQLNGCYVKYEISGFRQGSQTESVNSICGPNQASGAEFEYQLEMAFEEIVKGLGSGNSGLYAGGYESVNVLGQCQGDLGSGECVNCVKNAIEKAKNDCETSISAQIYLQECYLSYSYNPNGVSSNKSVSSGTARNTQKTVAIVMGCILAAGLIAACLLCTRSSFKKKNYAYRTWA